MTCSVLSLGWTHIQLKARCCRAATSTAETLNLPGGRELMSSIHSSFPLTKQSWHPAYWKKRRKNKPHSHNYSCRFIFCLSHGTIRASRLSEWLKGSGRSPFPLYFAQLLKRVCLPIHGHMTLLQKHSFKVFCQSQITSTPPKLLFSFRGVLIPPRIVQLLNFNWIKVSAVKPHLSHKFRHLNVPTVTFCLALGTAPQSFLHWEEWNTEHWLVKYRTLVIFTFLRKPVLPSQLIM